MQKALPLLRGTTTLSAALDDDDNVLQELAYPEQRIQFYTYLLTHRAETGSIFSHLRLNRKQTCRVGEGKEWTAGSLNVCILVFPLPYKVGEEKCPSVHIPHLRGFGLAGGQQFTAIEHRLYLYQLAWRFRRYLARIFGWHLPSPYTSGRWAHGQNTGHLLMDYVETLANKPLPPHRFDGQAQLSVLTTMQALLPHFTSRKFQHGPFLLSLADLHQSNILSKWNITSLVDLDGRAVDQLQGEHLDTFNEVLNNFMDMFKEEERTCLMNGNSTFNLTHTMKSGWVAGKSWYFHAPDSPKGLYNILLDHIQPRFTTLDDPGMGEFERTVTPRPEIP
ncbi:hypothetical protein BDV12DRAFT_210982 [Aspergillus spectabilis]